MAESEGRSASVQKGPFSGRGTVTSTGSLDLNL
jgi:hypothetical protein